MKLILDCDTGIDDAWAICALLQSELKFNFKVVAITCVLGNTDVRNSVQNTLQVLKVCERLDIPVYAGAEAHIIHDINKAVDSYHGIDGLGGVYSSSEKPSYDHVQKKHAIQAMKDFIEDSPNEIMIMAIGPLTNIALLYKIYPNVTQKIKNLFIMGGNHSGVGNITKNAEFNFYSDPEAAHIVFSDSKCPVTVLPLESCIESSKHISFKKYRMIELTRNGNKLTKFLDPMEKVIYKGCNEWMPCDLFLAAAFVLPDIMKKKEEYHVTIELSGQHTRGMMVIDHNKQNEPNALIIKEIDVDIFKGFVKWICGHDVESE